MGRFEDRLARALGTVVDLRLTTPYPVSIFWNAGETHCAVVTPHGATELDLDVFAHACEDRLWTQGLTLELAADMALLAAALETALAMTGHAGEMGGDHGRESGPVHDPEPEGGDESR